MPATTMWLRHEGQPMFSEDDVKRIYTAFPLATGIPLHVVRSNSGFVNLNHTKPRICELIGLVPGDVKVPFKIKLSEIAEKLDLQDDTVERLLPLDESGWLLAEDETVITRTGYQALCKALFSQADEGPIIITSFIKSNDITENTFQKLVKDINASLSSNDAEVVQGYLLTFWGQRDELVYSKRYRRWLEEEVATIMKAADRPKAIIGSTFQGDPPKDFLEFIANSLCEMNFDGIDGHISRNLDGEIEFFPRIYLLTQRDKLLQDLRNGKIPSLQYADLIGLDPQIVDAGRLADSHLEGYAIALEKGMISKVCFEGIANAVKSNLESQGWACVSTAEAKPAAEDMNLLLDLIRKHVQNLHGDSEIKQILPRSDYLFLADWVRSCYKNIESETHYLAQEHWNKGRELKLPWLLLCEALAKMYPDLGAGVVREILEQRKSKVEAAFLSHIRMLQEGTVIKFSHAWKEKVLARLQNYRIGIQNLSDPKLREELHSTLFGYTLKALVPEFLQKSRSKGMIRGRSLERDVEKLQQALTGINVGVGKPKDPFAPMMEAIDAFTRAIKVETLTDAELEERKAIQVREMVNNMKKDEDGPRLFLTLVLVLHAAHGPGIVYSTGKYAPRLLRLLTDVMRAGEYEWAQHMKEAAKSSSMTSEEKAEIRAMAVQACGGPNESNKQS